MPDAESVDAEPVHWGVMLRRARENAGLTQAELADRLVTHQTMISHLELGKNQPDDTWAKNADRALGADGLLSMAYRMMAPYLSQRHPNWDAYEEYRKIEARAVRLYDLSTGRLSGLLQTEEYMRAMFVSYDPGDAEARVVERLARQARRFSSGQPSLVSVIDEAVLWRVVGSPAVMRAQCERLLDSMQNPNCVIQVLPFGDGAAQMPMSGMIIVEQGGGQKRVYSESLDQGHFIDSARRVSRYVDEYDRLRARALSQQESAELIRSVMEGMADDQGFLDQEQLLGRERRTVRRVRRTVRYPRLRPHA
ncbi:helix-turn-helix domain-containing protein [Kitasatospora sp. NPDC058965]|uniref:helix-turn-helix domain-containing protein n=1 Tax=Kitasatospora sp. NPDC058965 TaxID=3346682 RepID=UPI0036C7F812